MEMFHSLSLMSSDNISMQINYFVSRNVTVCYLDIDNVNGARFFWGNVSLCSFNQTAPTQNSEQQRNNIRINK